MQPHIPDRLLYDLNAIFNCLSHCLTHYLTVATKHNAFAAVTISQSCKNPACDYYKKLCSVVSSDKSLNALIVTVTPTQHPGSNLFPLRYFKQQTPTTAAPIAVELDLV